MMPYRPHRFALFLMLHACLPSASPAARVVKRAAPDRTQQPQPAHVLHSHTKLDRLDTRTRSPRETPLDVHARKLSELLADTEQRLGPDSMEAQGAVIGLAQAEVARGHLSDAEPLLRRGIAWHVANNFPGAPMLRERLAGVLSARGEYAAAEAELRTAHDELARVRPNNARALRTLAQLASLLATQDKVEEAHALLQPAFEHWLATYGEAHPQIAWFRNELAMLAGARGDVATQERLLRQAVDGFELALKRSQKHPELVQALGSALRNLASVRAAAGDLAEAEALFRRSLTLARAVSSPETQTRALLYLGVFLAKHGKSSEGEALLREALRSYEQALPADHPLLLAVCVNLGELALSVHGDAADAEVWYRRAVEIAEKGWAPRMFAALSGLARSLELKGEQAAAEATHQQAVASAEAQFGPMHPVVLSCLDDLARFYAATDRPNEELRIRSRAAELSERLLAHALAAGSDRQRRAFAQRAGIRSGVDGALTLNLQRAPTSPATAGLALTTLLRTKGRALEATADAARRVRRGLNVSNARQLAALAARRAALAILTFRGPEKGQSAKDFQTAYARASEEVDALERPLGTRAGGGTAAAEAVSWERVQKVIPCGTALVEFVLYRPLDAGRAQLDNQRWGASRYAAYLLSCAGDPAAFDLGPADEIDALTTSLRERIARRSDEWREPASALYARLVQPYATHLAQLEVLFIAPDAGLNLLPFATLLDGRAELMVAHHRLTFLASGRDLLAQRSGPSARTPSLVIGALAYGSPRRSAARDPLHEALFSALPGTGLEARTVRQALGDAVLWTGVGATELAFKQVHGPRVLHLATHGFFLNGQLASQPAVRGIFLAPGELPLDQEAEPYESDGQPLLRAGVALSGANRRVSGANEDGIVTALELASIDLDGTELVTLSACETALGEVERGEGVLGLRRALVMAGSRTQLLSLWRIADQSTVSLMSQFYRGLAQGESRSAALRNAQLALLASPAYGHPYFWAGFVLSGEDGPMPRGPR